MSIPTILEGHRRRHPASPLQDDVKVRTPRSTPPIKLPAVRLGFDSLVPRAIVAAERRGGEAGADRGSSEGGGGGRACHGWPSLSGCSARRAPAMRAVLNTLFAALTRRRVFGAEHVPTEGPCLLVFNHLSRLDGPLLYTAVPRPDLSALVTADYRRRPLHRVLIEAAGGVWVRRGAGDRAALAAALDLLEQGRIVAVAPEGRISPTEALVEAKPGPAYLAARANVPIVPVAVTGTERVGDGLKRLRRVTLTVRFGEPFWLPPLAPTNRKQQREAATDLIMGRLAALLPPEYRGAYADHPGSTPNELRPA